MMARQRVSANKLKSRFPLRSLRSLLPLELLALVCFIRTMKHSLLSAKRSKIIKTDKKYETFLKNPNAKSMFVKPTSEKEVKNIIHNLNPNKSSGPNSFPTKIFKYISNIISKPICDLVNMSISNGVFPDSLKIAEVIPIYKKDSKLLCDNYRPISLLSNLSKIFEKILHERTYCSIFRHVFRCTTAHQ